MSNYRFTLTAAVALLGSVAFSAGTLTGQYYAMSGVNSGFAVHPDAEQGIDGGIVTGLVENNLGPNGLPVASAYGLSYAGPSGPLTDVNANNELLWWTGHSVYNGASVQFDHTSNDALPINLNNLYPFGAGGDQAWYQTGHWSGNFLTPAGGNATFTVGGDDDVWVFLNNQLIVDGGGVHGFTASPVTISGLNPGNNDIEVFFADRHQTGSQIYIDADVRLNPVPEPAPFAAFGFGVLGLIVRRRRSAK